MTEKEILDKQNEIIDCARLFRHDANHLMNELAKDFDFSLAADGIFPEDIYHHKYNNKGVFREEWVYYFHGSECRFEHLKTGQVVELIYITKPEFGFLDGYFFYNYMSTTGKFKELANWFGDHMNVWTAIELLADRNILNRNLPANTQRNIIAF